MINEVASAYDRWADTYDTDLNRTRELAAAVLRQSDLELAGRDVVEIGCGTGRNTEWIVERAASVLAVDFSEGMLRQAQARVRSPRARFIQHDIRNAWPLAEASADLVIAMLVLEHIEQVGPVFAEAARVLRAGGELFVCELHPVRQMYGKQARFTNKETGECERIRAFLHDVSEYVNGALQSGFELSHLGEWRDRDSDRSDLPRLLSLRLRLRAL
ncbi:MAG TPA: class I SAM-dependent methyltransferase [Blastocatellia bacterium]|nr:class I SAM-dependent methyltransferase [Blastocatellia bacterium]